jgi:hypothetical protein
MTEKEKDAYYAKLISDMAELKVNVGKQLESSKEVEK